ncbi:MAG: AsmA family protein [Gammaproteobacteria bacterium]|nr:AsmA family protein [Gammaproteobacteria bacterium]
MKSKLFLKFLAALSFLLIMASLLIAQTLTTVARQLIQDVILANTGYELTIAGDIDLRLLPSLELKLNDVRLRNPSYPQELSSTSSLSLEIDARALFRGDLYIRELSADDLHANIYYGEDGTSIWSNGNSNGSGQDQLASQIARDAVEADSPTVTIENIRVLNASADIQNAKQGLRYGINNMNLEGRNINNKGRPFDTSLNFDFSSAAMGDPLPIGLRSKILLNSELERILLSELNFSITPMLVSGSIEINNLSEGLSYDGQLESTDTDLAGLLQTLSYVEIENQFSGEINSTEILSFVMNFSGDADQVALDEFEAKLGETEIQATGDIRFPDELSPISVRYDVITGNIDFSPFLLSETPSPAQPENSFLTSSPPQSSASTDRSLPVDAIRMGNVLGSIAIESISASDLTIQNVNLFTNIEDGVLDVELQPTGLYGGTAQGLLRVDTSQDKTLLVTQLSLDGLSIGEIIPENSKLNPVTGQLGVKASYEASGQTISELLNTLNGLTEFTINENSVDIGLLKQVFTELTALSTSGESIQQWPDIIQFGELNGVVILRDGITDNQEINLRMDNFDIGGNGGVDLDTGSFNYDLQFSILGPPARQTLLIDDLYHDVPWPVECSARFTDAVSQYCSPDFTRVREIFTQLGTNELRRRVEEEITDAVPDVLQEPVNQILRRILN